MSVGRAQARGDGTSRRVAAAVLVLLVVVTSAWAVTFPTLTGRVVDQANLLTTETRASLETKLSDLETKSGIQLVVATVSSLEGQEIEPYANDLFRAWKLGEQAKNNGVLLLVAPNERRVRIEVGYGLEATLTDALSKVIIANAMTPRFKAGDFNDGITRGVDDVITVLTTDASEWQARPSLRLDNQSNSDMINWLILGPLLIGLVVLLIVSPNFRWFFFNMVFSMLQTSGTSRGGGLSNGGFSGGGSSGGGFSGGGGSSGGGGASGSW